MRLSVILFILWGITLLLPANVYSLNLNDQADKYSLNSSLIPLNIKELNSNINLASNSMLRNPPSLIKPDNAFGLFNKFNQNLINTPLDNTETNNGYNFTDQVREGLISGLTSLAINKKIESKPRVLCNPELLFDFYFHRGIQPVWVTQNGLNHKAEVLIKAIRKAGHEGLEPETYHQDQILTLLIDIEISRITETPEPAKLAELDLILTDAFFSYGFHLSDGLIEPHSNNLDWHIKKPKKNLSKILQTLLYNNKLEELVDILQPSHSGYLRLKSALLKYQSIKKSGGWNKVPVGSKIHKGDSGKQIAALRSRLIISGDIEDSKNSDREYFDEALEDGLKRFQGRHGLKIDGIAGSNTLSALNVPVEDRIEQIRLNMERWRWLPQKFEDRYLLVNTANFELNVIENEQTIRSIRVIVGKKRHATPIFSRKITYMVLNPYWNIPNRIALNEILPQIKRDSGYLTDKSIRVFENRKKDSREINPESIDWNSITKTNFSYRLRQDPKASNALGRVKFIFPNEFSVYLHDTPTHELFNMNRRTFSFGCVRIEKPIELATYLLQDHSKWNLEKLTTAVNSKKTKAISFSDPIAIHILYWTAWVDEDGMINFRDDIYGRDSKLRIALNERAASPELLYEENSESSFSTHIQPVSHPPQVNIDQTETRAPTRSFNL